MKFFFMNSMLMFNFIFISLNHPMSMGLMILIQLFLSMMIMNLYMNLSWFSYMMFLLFVGGMLILFIYMCSISSNNIMIISPNMIIQMCMFMTCNFFICILMNNNFLLINKWINMINLSLSNKIMDLNMNMIFLMKMFNNYSTYIIIFIIIYLFIMMIMINKITNLKMGPLRKMN